MMLKDANVWKNPDILSNCYKSGLIRSLKTPHIQTISAISLALPISADPGKICGRPTRSGEPRTGDWFAFDTTLPE